MVRRVFLTLLWFLAGANFAGAVEYYFPIMAAGLTEAGSDTFYVTEFVINNPNNQKVNGFLTFYANDGTPMDVGLKFVEATGTSTDTDSFFSFSVPGNGAWRAYTTDIGVLKTGWVALDTDDFVSPSEIFSLNSKKSGLISEATVFDSSPALLQRLFADAGKRSANISSFTDQTASDTGVAIANTSTQTATVTIRLLNSAGATAQTATITLSPLAATAKFLKEFFPSVTTFQGTVQIQSNVRVAAIGLRYTGPVFTTFPVTVLD